MCRLMIYNVVMSPLRGFGSWWALWFVGVTPTLFCVAPSGLGGGILSVGIRRLVPNTIVLYITFSLQSYYFFFEYANFVRTNCIFCRILVVLWEIACGWWLFMPIFDGE